MLHASAPCVPLAAVFNAMLLGMPSHEAAMSLLATPNGAVAWAPVLQVALSTASAEITEACPTVGLAVRRGRGPDEERVPGEAGRAARPRRAH